MVWSFRILVAGLAVAYAGWLGLPLVQALSAGATLAQAWLTLAPSGAVPGMVFAALLVASIGLYGLGGLSAAAGLSWAPGLFGLGFLGEIGLRLAFLGGMIAPAPFALDVAARTDALLRTSGLLAETAPLSLAGLLAIGLCVLPARGLARRRPGARSSLSSRSPIKIADSEAEAVLTPSGVVAAQQAVDSAA